jgi:hypothetical protein
MTDTRKRRTFTPGAFVFRNFDTVEDADKRALTAQAKAAAKRSTADSLLRRFSWEGDQ